MNVSIRTAEPDDKEACLGLISALTGRAAEDAWGPVFDHLLTGERGGIIVAEEDGTVLGLAAVSYNLAVRYAGEYCQLEELIVDTEARGKNLGALLVASAVTNAKRRGCAEMGLYLVERTEGNRSFYEKCGFRYVGSEMRQQLR